MEMTVDNKSSKLTVYKESPLANKWLLY